jgi:hypothetical protein
MKFDTLFETLMAGTLTEKKNAKKPPVDKNEDGKITKTDFLPDEVVAKIKNKKKKK